MFEYQVETTGCEFSAYREFETENELREFAKTTEAFAISWGRHFRFMHDKVEIDIIPGVPNRKAAVQFLLGLAGFVTEAKPA